MQSHPTWVRGLKHEQIRDSKTTSTSHPTWVRGLKPLTSTYHAPFAKSHPTWVRGLKPLTKQAIKLGVRRTLRGCVD